MAGHVCPWWFCFTFDNALRRLVQDPQKILGPYVSPGQTALDVGCGMGYFSMGLARLVGPGGMVVSVDLQEKMLQGVERRAARLGLGDVVQTHQCQSSSLGLGDLKVDFALAFYMVHEVPDQDDFLRQVGRALRPGGCFLVAEPKMHVSLKSFENMVQTATSAGMKVIEQPSITFSRAVLLRKD